MERAIYVAIKRTYTAQLATQKRELLDRVPMLSTLSQVPARRPPIVRAQALMLLWHHAVVTRACSVKVVFCKRVCDAVLGALDEG